MKEDITPQGNNMERIEKLDRDLYDPTKDHNQKPRRRIHDRDINLDHDFDDEDLDSLLHDRPKYFLPTSFFKKIFFVVFSFFILTVVVAGISLYDRQESVSEDLIALEILGQPFIDGGEELELQVRVQNFNEQNLELPDLVLSYPKDSSVDSERVYLRRSLDDLGSKERTTAEFDLVLFGQEGDMRQIEATLEYRIAGSSAIFIKEAQHDVIIRSTPTDILVTAPDTIVRNQELTLSVDVSSNSSKRINDTLLKIDYPRGFNFIRSNISPSYNDNAWYFDTIKDDAKTIEITGRLAALEGQAQSFAIEYGKQSQTNKNQLETIFNGVTKTIEIQRSFIDARLVVGEPNSSITAVRGGSDVPITLTYENTLAEPIQNAVIEVVMSGELFNPNEVRALRGFYDSSNQKVVFDSGTTERLANLQPGEQGEVSFTVKTNNLSNAAGVLVNPSLDLAVNVFGTEDNGQQKEALSIASHRIIANSDIAVKPTLQYFEGSFENKGPLPPRANIQTTYTLLFQASNSSNTINEARITTVLPRYVEWQNAITPSTERNNVSFDRATNTLKWELGTLESGLGFGTNQPRTLSVQVAVTPSISQVGADFDMTGDIIFDGFDSFTDTNLSFKKSPLKSSVFEAQAPGGSGRVVN